MAATMRPPPSLLLLLPLLLASAISSAAANVDPIPGHRPGHHPGHHHQPSPALIDPVPGNRQPSPAHIDSVPGHHKPSPALNDPIPGHHKPSPAHIDSVPGHQKPSPALAISAPNKDIVKICSATSYKHLCLITTQPFVPIDAAIDQNLIIQLEMKAVQNKIKQVVTELNKLIAQPPTLPPVADDKNSQKRYVSGLTTCRDELNNTALSALSKSEDDLRDGNTYMFNQHMTGVTGAASDCQDDFDDVDATFWPAADVQAISNMADNCMAIMQDATPEYDELPGGGRKRLL